MLKLALFLPVILVYLTRITIGEDWHFQGANIALNKPATHMPSTYRRLPAEKAVDGNTTQILNRFDEGSCSHTNGDKNGTAYWTVSFNGYFILKGIKIYNRIPSIERLYHFKVIGGDRDGVVLYDDALAEVKLFDNSIIMIAMNSTTPFTKLTILVPAVSGINRTHEFDKGVAFVILCEVQVFAAMHGCIISFDKTTTWKIKESTGFSNDSYGLVSNGSVIEFGCKYENFKLNKTDSITCRQDGSYSGSIPVCIEIICLAPSLPDGGFYVSERERNFTKGDIISIQCKDGYVPRHLQLLECVDTSTWNGSDTHCTLINCSYPTSFTNGSLLFTDGTIFSEGFAKGGDILNITCDEGFFLQSSSTQCTYDGSWNQTPQCTLIVCEHIGDVSEGFFYYSSEPIYGNKTYAYGTVAKLNCTGHSYIIGGANSTRVCGQSGQWTGNTYVCRRNSIDRAQHSPGPDVSHGIIGGLTAGAVLLIVGVGFFSFILIRKRRSKGSKDETLEEENKDYNSRCTHAAYSLSSNVTEELDDNSKDPSLYYNINGIQRIPESAIQLSDLAQFINNIGSNKDALLKQFEKLPYGLQKTYKAASGAKGKNRYRNLYAYDDTRVVLDIWNRKTDSDYINACYVDGLNKTKAYIASQGPTSNIIDDFWRMIWQNGCEKIIMLTNLKENGKMKCEKYWPKSDTETYGEITVQMIQEHTFSNFVIRKFNVSMAPEESRIVTQFHFTAWPDKDVPLFCSSLVHFHYKVKEEMKPEEAPMVVHCSAGIGRTGTFIAIDNLYDQARELDYIDVFSCVLSLRQQRVNMVQTKSQYIYVHQALAEMFSLKTSVVTSANFDEHYSRLLTRENDSESRNIDKEFELLEKMAMPREENKTDEEIENTPKEADFMPSISQPGLYLFGEYIDASFLSIYKEDMALIMARSPSEKTHEDFWKLIYHQNVHTIVMMNNKAELKSKDIYWPNTDKDVHFGDISIHAISVTRRYGHNILVLTLATGDNVRRLQLIQFGGWKDGNSTPDNAESVLSAIDCVEENQRQTGNHPVLVHCMDGAEKSGLFCVIMSLLDRTKIEQDVAISQVIQEIRARRSNVIPNVNQFQFCHEVVLSFLQRHDTYANFAIS